MDPGAEVIAISVNTHKQLKEPKLTTANKILYGPSRTKLTVIGTFNATLSRGNTTIKQPMFVVDGLKTNLLGLPAIAALNLAVRLDATVEEKPDVHAGKTEKYPSVFQGLGNLGEEYESQMLHHTLSLLQDTYHYL